MKEIGGYIELDYYKMPMLHEDGILLNCGRNALAYIIEARKIQKLWLPYFLCDSIRNVCRKYNVQPQFYHINEKFEPVNIDLDKDDWLYIVNYYGQLSCDKIKELVIRYQKIIVDNSQDYFAEPIPDIDILYTCRKYFGVPDGGVLYTNAGLKRELCQDESYERIHYILGRFERTASEFYAESAWNNDFFADEPIKKMSKLTKNLLHGIDYEWVKKVRTENFSYLHEKLGKLNQLEIHPVIGAFMYPLMLKDAERIRKYFLEKKIYVPILWPNVLDNVSQNWLEWKLAKYILPLPCDQRYGIKEMNVIVNELMKCMEK